MSHRSRLDDAEEQRFLAAVADLATAAEASYPTWARLLRERPAVYVPHKPYAKYDGSPEVGCCEFDWDHPIHNMPDWHRQHVLRAGMIDPGPEVNP